MTLGIPLWLWGFAAFPILIALFFRNERRRAQLLGQLIAARLHDRLAGTVSITKRRARFALLLLGLAGVLAALAQPRLGYTWEESKRKGRDVLIAIDVSKSMLATDLTPTRLGRAKLAAQDLITQLEGDRVGLIAFAGTSFLQAPLTIDFTAVLGALQEIDPEIIPRGGTNIAAAIRAARDAFGKGESEHRALIIFTDGEELEEDAIKAAEEQKDVMRIFTIGIGSADGSLIPLPEVGGEFVKDAQGQIVKSRLDEERLTKIAKATGGFYTPFRGGRAEMERLVRDGIGKMNQQDIDARLSRQPIERYQWPLSAGMLCLALSLLIGERKRARVRTTAAAILCAGLFPSVASAKNPGVEAYEREKYEEAEERFTEQAKRRPSSEELHYNLGTAAFKQRQYDDALEAFARAMTTKDQGLRARAEYNFATTLAMRADERSKKDAKGAIQDLENAVQHYDQSRKAEPLQDNSDANSEWAKYKIAFLKKEQQKAEQQKKEKQKKDKKDGKKDQKDKGEKGEKGEKEEKGEQEGQEPQDGEKQEGEEGKEGEAKDGKEGEPKDGKGEEAKGEKGEQKEGDEEKDGKEGEGSEEAPAQEKKAEGDLKAAPQYGKDQQGKEAEEQAAAEAAAAAGKMTDAQARALLDSLKGEDDRVQLLNPKDRKPSRSTLRDW